MDEIKETLNVDKAFVDAARPGLNITIDSSAGTGGLAPAAIANSLGELVVRMGNADAPLALWPLRYILVTANLGDAVNTWNHPRTTRSRRLKRGRRQAHLLGQ
jgi:hypothetical protein